MESKIAEYFKRSGDSIRSSMQRLEGKVASQGLRVSEISGTVQGLSEEAQRQVRRVEGSEQRLWEFGQHLEELIQLQALAQKAHYPKEDGKGAGTCDARDEVAGTSDPAAQSPSPLAASTPADTKQAKLVEQQPTEAKAEAHLMYGLEDVMLKVEQLDRELQSLRCHLGAPADIDCYDVGGACEGVSAVQASVAPKPRASLAPEARFGLLEAATHACSSRLGELSERTIKLSADVAGLRQAAAGFSSAASGSPLSCKSAAGVWEADMSNTLMHAARSPLSHKGGRDFPGGGPAPKELRSLHARITAGEACCASVQEQIGKRMEVVDRLIRQVAAYSHEDGAATAPRQDGWGGEPRAGAPLPMQLG